MNTLTTHDGHRIESYNFLSVTIINRVTLKILQPILQMLLIYLQAVAGVSVENQESKMLKCLISP